MHAPCNSPCPYTLDQEKPPGLYPVLESAFWQHRRNLLVALWNGLSTANMALYDLWLSENSRFPENIANIAKAFEEKQAEKKQG